LAFESHHALQQGRKSGKSNRKRVRKSHRAIFWRAETNSIGVLPIRAPAPTTLFRKRQHFAEQNESGGGAGALKAGKAEVFSETGIEKVVIRGA
jgi:hypothetical protein